MEVTYTLNLQTEDDIVHIYKLERQFKYMSNTPYTPIVIEAMRVQTFIVARYFTCY